jgi:hypothetical protein
VAEFGDRENLTFVTAFVHLVLFLFDIVSTHGLVPCLIAGRVVSDAAAAGLFAKG